jgi:hypothetical protein
MRAFEWEAKGIPLPSNPSSTVRQPPEKPLPDDNQDRGQSHKKKNSQPPR